MTNPRILVAVMSGLLVGSTLLGPATARADGMFVAPPGWYLFEQAQHAFIRYDADAGTEELTILPEFQGDARSFAWIVPVPALPDLAAGDPQLFRDLRQLTLPVYHRRDGEWGCSSRQVDYSPQPLAPSPVDVISRDLVGYYQTLTIAATEADALLDSLTDWGFLHSQNQAAVTDAITDYVAKSWYFVAMKVDSTALANLYPYGDESYPVYGGLEPIQFNFASDAIVYPMKISSVSAYADSRVRLFVAAAHRQTYSGARTNYANRFTAAELSELSALPTIRQVLRPGDFLTELYREFKPSEMNADIVLEQAPNDDEFLQVYYSGLPWTGLVVLLPALFMAAKRRFWLNG